MMNMHNPVDIFGGVSVGKAMSFYRRQSKLSQQAMADMLSVPHGIYKKYESGSHPVSRDCLAVFLDCLNISLSRFEATLADQGEALALDLPDDVPQETLHLVDSFATLDPAMRKNMLDVVKVLLDQEMGHRSASTGQSADCRD